VQADVPVHSFVISEMSLGLDGVLRFYRDNEMVCDAAFEEAFIKECHWTPLAARPYAVKASDELVDKLHTKGVTVKGVTLTANGFYATRTRASFTNRDADSKRRDCPFQIRELQNC